MMNIKLSAPTPYTAAYVTNMVSVGQVSLCGLVRAKQNKILISVCPPKQKRTYMIGCQVE